MKKRRERKDFVIQFAKYYFKAEIEDFEPRHPLLICFSLRPTSYTQFNHEIIIIQNANKCIISYKKCKIQCINSKKPACKVTILIIIHSTKMVISNIKPHMHV